jgi:hypothetical protein
MPEHDADGPIHDGNTQPLPANATPTAPTEPLLPADAAASGLATAPLEAPRAAPLPPRQQRTWLPWTLVGALAILLAVLAVLVLPRVIPPTGATTTTPTPTPSATSVVTTTADPEDGTVVEPAPPPPAEPAPAPEPTETAPPPPPDPTIGPTEEPTP